MMQGRSPYFAMKAVRRWREEVEVEAEVERRGGGGDEGKDGERPSDAEVEEEMLNSLARRRKVRDMARSSVFVE